MVADTKSNDGCEWGTLNKCTKTKVMVFKSKNPNESQSKILLYYWKEHGWNSRLPGAKY